MLLGFTSDRSAMVRTDHVLMKGYSVVAVGAGEYGRRFPKRGRKNRQAIWYLANSGRLSLRIHAELSLANTFVVVALLQNQEAVGKVVIYCDR